MCALMGRLKKTVYLWCCNCLATSKCKHSLKEQMHGSWMVQIGKDQYCRLLVTPRKE